MPRGPATKPGWGGAPQAQGGGSLLCLRNKNSQVLGGVEVEEKRASCWLAPLQWVCRGATQRLISAHPKRECPTLEGCLRQWQELGSWGVHPDTGIFNSECTQNIRRSFIKNPISLAPIYEILILLAHNGWWLWILSILLTAIPTITQSKSQQKGWKEPRNGKP